MITTSVLRELAEHRGDPAVSTVYLDVDGRHRPVATQCTEALDALADQLRRAAPDERSARSAEADVARMRAWIETDLDRTAVDGAATRGLAMFSCADQDWFRVVELRGPVRDEVALGPVPRLGQLLEQAQVADTLLLALVDRRRLRLVEVRDARVVDVATLDEPAPRAIDSAMETGRHERYFDELARTHFRHAAAEVGRAVGERPGIDLSLAGPDEAVAGLAAQLENGARARLVDRVHLAVTSPEDEIAEAARRLLEELAHRRETAAVDELRQRAAADDRAVIGLQATLAAVSDKRVDRLLVSVGLRAGGTECPSCGHLDIGGPAAGADRCARCGSDVVRHEDVVDVAVDRTIAQHATVELYRTEELAALGGIGALERF